MGKIKKIISTNISSINKLIFGTDTRKMCKSGRGI